MKKAIYLIVCAFLLSSCSGWVIQRLPYNPPTPIMIASHTPAIYSPTPLVTPATVTPTFTPAPIKETATPSVTPTDISSPTVPAGAPGLQVVVLGCNTSIDVSHGMGEVTNAYVILRNTGGTELTNVNTTLRALDEGREHPDKTVEVDSLFAGYKVSLKLTVDSTYQEQTPIQIEVAADGGLFQRVGAESCGDVGLFAPNPSDLTTPVPNNP